MADVGKEQHVVGHAVSCQLFGELSHILDHRHVIGGAVNEQHRPLNARGIDLPGTASQPSGVRALKPRHGFHPTVGIHDR